MMSQVERMLSGKLYSCLVKDEQREEMHLRKAEFLDQFNATNFSDFQAREKLARGIFTSVGKNFMMNKPFYCDYGCHISIGDYFYANFDCIFLDVARITIGNHVFLGPRVCIYTAGHPIDRDIRNQELEYGYEVKIGNDVWIGGNTIINPGVTIADNVVIGSGSVVTKDIPSGVVAAGNPCKVIRPITQEDKVYWKQQADDFFKDK